MSLPLVVGMGLALLGERRGWAPSIAVSLAVGAALRVFVMGLAAWDDWQPWDFAVDFLNTADAVREGKDPLTSLREGGWHFLPFLAYVLAGQRELGVLLGLEWDIVGRLVPVLCDLALIPVVAKLARERHALRGFQYACMPVALMVSALHGQFGPITLLCGAGALLLARSGRAHHAGILLGLAATSATWAGLMLPGILMTVPTWRQRAYVVVWAAAVPIGFLLSSIVFLGTPFSRMPDTVSAVLSARPVTGDWGWSAIATGGDQIVSPAIASVGTPVLGLGVLAALWLWRRADPLTLTLVLVTAFLVFTYRFGAQYLLWTLPYLIARAPRHMMWAVVSGALWAAFGYLVTTQLKWNIWGEAHVWWSLSSFLVIATFLYALPPRHEDGPPEAPAVDGLTPQRTAPG